MCLSGFTFDGQCYQDCQTGGTDVNGVKRVLPDDFKYGAMTIGKCKNYCFGKGFTYAGVQNGNECFCGNEINPSAPKPSSECNKQCTGDRSQTCGGGCRLNVYKNIGN